MKYALGIDIGGTNTKIGLVDQEGVILQAEFIPTQSNAPFEEFVERVFSKSNEILKKNNVDILGVGIGAPNANSKTGCIEHPPNLNWKVADLKSKFTELFNTKVMIENDANISACGEKLWGQGKNLTDFILVTLGTGVGTGIFSNNNLINSYNGMATEGGHIPIEKNGRPCGCGGYGHLETYVGVKGIKQTVKEITGEDLKFSEILERFNAKDPQITKAVEITADYLAYGLAPMFTLFIPQRIILAGGVSNLGEAFCKLVNESFQKYAYTPFKSDCQVTLSEISLQNGAILGAASLLITL